MLIYFEVCVKGESEGMGGWGRGGEMGCRNGKVRKGCVCEEDYGKG